MTAKVQEAAAATTAEAIAAMTATATNQTNRFVGRVDIIVYSELSALQIARNLKIGLWLEDFNQYVDGAKCLTNLDVSRVEVILAKEGEKPQEYLVSTEFTFESDQSEGYLNDKTVLYFGENSSSLHHATEKDRYLIETVDYGVFELYQER